MAVAMNNQPQQPGSPGKPRWGPIIDGDIVKYDVGEAIATGKIKPNTPVVNLVSDWDTKKDGRAADGLRDAIPTIPDMADDFSTYEQLLEDGFKVPSDFSDRFFEQIYGENFPEKTEFYEAFGCPSVNDEVQECHDPFSKWFNSNVQYCVLLNQWHQLLPVKF